MGIVRKTVQYLLALGVAGALLWLVFRQIDVSELLARLKDVKYGYIIASIVIMLMAHWIRAFRWKIMLKPVGFNVSTFRTFNAVLVGYFANLFLPRMGGNYKVCSAQTDR